MSELKNCDDTIESLESDIQQASFMLDQAENVGDIYLAESLSDDLYFLVSQLNHLKAKK